MSKSLYELLDEFDGAVGVPDSNLADLVTHLGRGMAVFVAPREDVAVAAACGMELAGARTLVYMKNAGLFTCGDALLSLAQDVGVGLFMLVGWAGSADDNLPHHVVSGQRTTAYLDALGVPWRTLTTDCESLHGWYHSCRLRRTHCAVLVPPKSGGDGHAR